MRSRADASGWSGDLRWKGRQWTSMAVLGSVAIKAKEMKTHVPGTLIIPVAQAQHLPPHLQLCYLSSLYITITDVLNFFSKSAPLKLINFSLFSLRLLNSDICYFRLGHQKSFLTLWSGIPPSLKPATQLPRQIHPPGEPHLSLWLQPNLSPNLSCFFLCPCLCSCGNHHLSNSSPPWRSMSNIIFPMKLPCPLQPEMMCSGSSFLDQHIAHHSSHMGCLRLLQFLCNRD